MNKNLKKILLFVNLLFINFMLMTITHELIHYSQRANDLKEICFMGYDSEIKAIAWFDDGINEYRINAIDVEPGLSILSLIQFMILTVIIGIVIKHKA